MNTKELYTRQEKLPLTIPNHCTIVGLGGTGCPTAQLLVMSGVPNLDLFDPDILELSNFNRIPLPPSLANQPKVAALTNWLESLRPSVHIIPHAELASPFTLLGIQADILFDCTDSIDAQTMLHSYCKAKSIRYIRVGYDGGVNFTVTSTGCEWTTDPQARSSYRIIPSWAVGSYLPACLAVAKALWNDALDFPSGSLNFLASALANERR